MLPKKRKRGKCIPLSQQEERGQEEGRAEGLMDLLASSLLLQTSSGHQRPP